MTFASVLRRCARKYPTIRAFAQALDVDPSHVSRAMGRGGLPFDVRGCLRLAKLTGENPGMILRASGKHEVADLLESLYQNAGASALSPDLQTWIAVYHAIGDPVIRRQLLVVATAITGTELHDAPPRRSGRAV